MLALRLAFPPPTAYTLDHLFLFADRALIKHVHEFRDPMHVFVRMDTHERGIVDSRPFQRLRHIHQLALSYLVYPAATPQAL